MKKTIEKLLKVIHRHCKECCGSEKEIKKCEITNCPLYLYRFGKVPKKEKKKKCK